MDPNGLVVVASLWNRPEPIGGSFLMLTTLKIHMSHMIYIQMHPAEATGHVFSSISLKVNRAQQIR